MVIAVVAMRMMQVAVDEIVDVIPMGHRFVTATRTMYMAGLVSAAGVIGSTDFGVRFADFDDMLFDGAVCILMVQMPVVQVVGMTIMIHGCVATLLAVLMLVIGVRRTHTVVS